MLISPHREPAGRDPFLQSGKLWSLWDMLELHAPAFLSAIGQLRALVVMLSPNRAEPATLQERAIVAQNVENLLVELEKVGARSALAAAGRLKVWADDPYKPITHADLQRAMNEIESRFADHLGDIQLFVLTPNEVVLMQPADMLLSTGRLPVEGFSLAYPNASFELEEAAKCCALGRYTAAVFHTMRASECGIKALAAFLDIPDPTKPAEKNWAIILKAIRDQIERKWPKGTRMPNSIGATMESLYATLDAIKNPWRNATMHVETIYAPHEALHILRCVSVFMLQLSKHCDEEGRSAEQSPAMVEQAPSELPVTGTATPA